MSEIRFPDDFFWGTAASAYQTEGGNFNNDWYEMEVNDLDKPPDEQRFHDPCAKACDHWNRYKEDYDLHLTHELNCAFKAGDSCSLGNFKADL